MFYQRLKFRQQAQTALEYAVGLCYNQTVIGEGHALSESALHAAGHFALIEHAAAAVYDRLVARQILRELRAGAGLDAHIRAGTLTNPAGDFHRADVAALPVMRAALSDEHCVAV